MLAAFALIALGQAPDGESCRDSLERLAAEARGQDYEAVEGPYEVAPGDLRVHAVVAEDGGHRIVEHRCESGRVVSRSWIETLGDGEEDEAWTAESLDRIAARLNKALPEQQ